MIVKCSRVSDHPKAESRQAALKKGWRQDKKGQWVCPKCQRGSDEALLNIETQQMLDRIIKSAKRRTKTRRLESAVLGGDRAVQFDRPRE